MTTMKVYSIYDSKAGGYLPPFFCPNNAVAIRSFASAVNQEGADFNRWASDYTLFCIGTFNPDNGIISTNDSHENLGLAVEYLNKEATPTNITDIRSAR